MRHTTRAGFLLCVSMGLIGAVFLGATRNRAFRNELRLIEQVLLTPWLDPAYMGSGKPARDLLLCDPVGLALDSLGNLFVSDRGRGRRGRIVWRIDTTGVPHVRAGSGRQGRPSDLSPSPTSLIEPEGLAVDAGGNLHVADALRRSIFRLDEDGGVMRVAGTGRRGFSGDGGPAAEASLSRPADIRFDSRGNLYIADVLDHRIRRIDTDGNIHTAAGVGEPGFSADGTLAQEAFLSSPWGIGIDNDDRLLIADSDNHRVRRIEDDGTLSTVAGNGQPGYSGDGGLATDASFDTPQALFVDAMGRIFIGDEHNHAVRVIDLDGTVSTLIGQGSPGKAAEGGLAADAALNDPENILVQPDGSVIITDGDNGRVIRITEDGVVRLLAGRSEPDRCLRRW